MRASPSSSRTPGRSELLRLVVVLAALAVLVAAATAHAQGISPDAAQRLYRQGVLPSGEPLIGERAAGNRLEGQAAACVVCHRRSGLGTAEGVIAIPPITGKYLFRGQTRRLMDVDYLRAAQGFQVDVHADSEASVARAIRDGVARDGRPLNYLMPRYQLDDATMAGLIAYLKGLSSEDSPGVTADTIHFATIVTPDADPVGRQAMLDVLDRFFADKNDFLRGGERPMVSPRGVKFRVSRKWQLHVWQLTGAPETWQRQLEQHLAAEPVFAVISGLGGRTWAPVHRFCEQAQLPCLFPNVDLPAVAEKDFYSVYFSEGVLLEAQLVARHLHDQAAGVRRLVQVYRLGDIGEEGAKALAAAAPAGIETVLRALPAEASPAQLAAALEGIGRGDALMLWLRPGDLAALPAPVDANVIFLSGSLGGLEQAPLPAAWRRQALMAYPFDLPRGRQVRMNFPLGWFKIRHIPVTAERVQTDTYVACGILSEMLTGMLDSFVRDYLLERIETMLSVRLTNGYYARLSLAQGQRFASKGGYVVRFADAAGTAVVADGGWVVP